MFIYKSRLLLPVVEPSPNMAFKSSILCLLVVICTTSAEVVADSIQGCGGFVQASSTLINSRKPTDVKLDYSDITVELRTLDGLVKDNTQCAPNGYYFIPVYDKGSFILRVTGPEGWSWDPDKVPVVIDHTGCNANEDINFQFTGFTLSGRVVGAVGGESCLLKNGGPSNVNILLMSPSGDLVSSVKTSSRGRYSFTNINPGKYKLRAFHPDLKIEVRCFMEVTLGFGNGKADDIFFVRGYNISGYVVAQGNPLLGVQIYLYSDDVLQMDCPQGAGSIPGKRKALCHAVSDADGLFTFSAVPCGSYNLIPYYKGENTVFDVSPTAVHISVEHHHLTIPQKFQVTGFSIGGRVVDGNDLGVGGVKIIVDGEERSSTDKMGYYKLDQVTSQRYTIEAKKEHYKFDRLKNFLVLPNMASIPGIKAVSYDVCGVVQMINTGHKAKVALTHGPENVKPRVKQTNGNGSFCFEVLPGEYRLSALASTSETDSGLIFLPSYVDVVVKNPLLNVVFSQALVNVYGTVACKEKCDPSVAVRLIKLAGKHTEEIKMVPLTSKSGEFVFSNVSPGKYGLEVKQIHPVSTSEDDNWCWEHDFIGVDVGVEDVKGIKFVQKGYWINVISTHDVDAYVTQPDGSYVNLKIKKDSQRICIESPGVHELRLVNSCVFFGSLPMKIDTFNPAPIYLKGEKYLLGGQIHVDSNSLGDEVSLTNISVDILDTQGTFVDTIVATLIPNKKSQEGVALYEYSIWAVPERKLVFIPRDSRTVGEKKILFYPRQQHVSVSCDACQAPIPTIYGRPGLYIEGSVTPLVADVFIRIIALGDSHYAELKKGETALEITTGADGVFVGGPLYDDIAYDVEASKPGYHLKPVGHYSFSCQKLGQISVHIDSEGAAAKASPPVLLSLSGDNGYRNNSVSRAGGNFLFDNLFPGSFYLRPLFKEYAFLPPAQAIELGSGESREVIFQAIRVAYSATGRITLLSGQPKGGVSVEARSESKGFYEEAVADSSGSYRLRGLLPETTYVIKIAKKDVVSSTGIERSSPESLAVKVSNEDIKGLDFVVFEQPERTILSCHVEGKRIEELHSHLRVEVKRAADPSKLESVFPLPLSHFFQVKDLPKGKYIIKLLSGLSTTAHKFISEVIEVDLENHTQIHVGPLRYRIEEDHRKQELTPAPVYPLIIGVSIIFLFVSMPRLKDI